MYNSPYLKDIDFLHKFDKNRNKEQFLKVTILDWKNESPIQEVTGSVLDGNISLDGSSAMRRTANISLLLDDYNYKIEDVKNIISINKKVQIMIGFENNTDKYANYPVLWFPQGIYIIISASISHDSNGIKVSLTLHDKMALLNGECGGVLPAATVFNEIQNEDEYGNITKEYPTIVQIIQQLVNHFGNEQLGKIIIKDLQPIVKQVLKWNGDSDTPLYIYQRDTGEPFVQLLSYEIYKKIFNQYYNGNKKNADAQFLNLLDSNGKNIEDLQKLLLNLLNLQKFSKNKNEELEKEKENLINLKKLLEQQNFSLISEVNDKINNIGKCLWQISDYIKNLLKQEIDKKKSTFDRFKNKKIVKKSNNKNIYQIFNVGKTKQLYNKLEEIKRHSQQIYNKIHDDSNNLTDKILKQMFVSLINFPLNYREKQQIIDKYPNCYGFSLPEVKNHNYINGKTSIIIPEIFIYPTDSGEIICRWGEKNNEYISIQRMSYFNESPMYYLFKEFLEVRKYLLNTSIYKTKMYYTKYDLFIFGNLSHYIWKIYEESTGKEIYSNLKDLVLQAAQGITAWCGLAEESLQQLIDAEQDLINLAKDIKNNLINSNVLNIGSSNVLLKDFQGSFYDFLNLQSKELKELISKLPLKKNKYNNKTKNDTSIEKNIRYREKALKYYQSISNKISELKKAFGTLNFYDFSIYSTSFKSNLMYIYQPITTKFINLINILINKENTNRKIFIDYLDTPIEKARHNKMTDSINKINKFLQIIQNYKDLFTKKSLIQVQQWINITDFGENKELPIELNTFLSQGEVISDLNSIFLQQNSQNQQSQTNNQQQSQTNISQLEGNIGTLINQINTNNFKTISLNKKLLDKIIKRISSYVDSNVQDINIKVPLQSQLEEYIQKIKDLIAYQDEKVREHIKKIKNNPEGNDETTTTFLEEIQKIQIFNSGEDIGYTLVDFIYPGSLTANAGETVTSILDKIKNTLGNYQYFYDINGNFVFQEIRNFINKSYSTYLLQENSSPSYNYNNTNGKYIYNFNDGEIIQSYSNSINYQDIKNDFIVWGERKTADGKKYPIRYHLAIDNKPATSSLYCIPIDKDTVEFYLSTQDFPREGTSGKYYYSLKENQCYEWISEYTNSSFFGYKKIDKKIKKCDEPQPKNANDYKSDTYYYYYENNTLKARYVGKEGGKNYLCFSSKDYRTELYLDGVINEELGLTSNDYYVELKNEWPKLFNFSQGAYYSSVKKNPDNIDYYLDLLSTSNLTSQYGIPLIGKRTKIITNNNINCIFEPTCPDYVFSFSENAINDMINLNQSKADQEKQQAELQKKRDNIEKYYNQWNEKNLLSQFSHLVEVDYNIYKNFANGGTARSAYQQIRSVLYQYLTYNQQVSLTTVPIYYLEPNNLIQINDNLSNIFGSYLIKSISLPLGKNSTMTINCTKAIEKI